MHDDQLDITYIVTFFGAKGDDITDDTPPIDAAIQALIGRHFVPSGPIIESTAIVIDDEQKALPEPREVM